MVSIAFKQRMVGAIFILSLGVILIPVILDSPQTETVEVVARPELPELPEIAEVAKISYVFNDIDEILQADSDVQPQPVVSLAKVDLAPEPEPEPSEPEPVEPAPAPIPKIAAKPIVPGDWTIQLGAFSSRQNADELLSKLTKSGFESYMVEVPGRNLVKVFVAPGVERNRAQTLLAELDNQMGLKGIIVRYRN